MGCGDAETAFESSFLTLLEQARYYNVRANTLTIRAAGGAIVLLFDAAPNNPLLGPWVVDSYASAPGALIAPIEGTELTAVFRLVKVGGSSGCNTYDGPYTTNGTLAAIGPLATTRMACAEDVMAQETAFLTALQGVGHLERRAQSISAPGHQREHGRRPAAAGRCRGGLPESERLGVCKPKPDVDAGDAQCQPVGEPQRAAEPDAVRAAEPDADADAHGCRHTVAGGTDHRTAGLGAPDRDLRPDPPGRGDRDDRLPVGLEHRDGAASVSLPLLRSCNRSPSRPIPRRS